MAALQHVDVPGYAALILRKTYADLACPVRSWTAPRTGWPAPTRAGTTTRRVPVPVRRDAVVRLPADRQRQVPLSGRRVPVHRLRRAHAVRRGRLPLPRPGFGVPPSGRCRKCRCGSAVCRQPGRPRPSLGQASVHRASRAPTIPKTRRRSASARSSCRPSSATTRPSTRRPTSNQLAALDPQTRRSCSTATGTPASPATGCSPRPRRGHGPRRPLRPPATQGGQHGPPAGDGSSSHRLRHPHPHPALWPLEAGGYYVPRRSSTSTARAPNVRAVVPADVRAAQELGHRSRLPLRRLAARALDDRVLRRSSAGRP
jgi:hypothetical protein